MTATAPRPTQELLTYEQYLEEFQTEAPTRQPYSIVDGVKIVSPSPRPLHQIIIYRLSVLFDAFERSRGIRVIPSPSDVLISREPLRVRQPDLLIMSEARYLEADIPTVEGPIPIAPELVVEVLSPSENRRTIGEKLADFQGIGVQECWLVSAEAETVEVTVLTKEQIRSVAVFGANQEVASITFPGVKLSVARMFDR
jgi:Uma2 family endonuclease